MLGLSTFFSCRPFRLTVQTISIMIIYILKAIHNSYRNIIFVETHKSLTSIRNSYHWECTELLLVTVKLTGKIVHTHEYFASLPR